MSVSGAKDSLYVLLGKCWKRWLGNEVFFRNAVPVYSARRRGKAIILLNKGKEYMSGHFIMKVPSKIFTHRLIQVMEERARGTRNKCFVRGRGCADAMFVLVSVMKYKGKDKLLLY